MEVSNGVQILLIIKGCSGGGYSPYEAIKELFANYKVHLRALKENGMLPISEYVRSIDLMIDTRMFEVL